MCENDRDSLGESAKVRSFETNSLKIPTISNEGEHFYSRSFNSRHKSDPLSVRLASTYRSLRCAYAAEDYPQKNRDR